MMSVSSRVQVDPVELRREIVQVKAKASLDKISFITNLLVYKENEEKSRHAPFMVTTALSLLSGVGIPAGIALFMCGMESLSEQEKYRRIRDYFCDETRRVIDADPLQAFESVYRKINNKFPEWAQVLKNIRPLSEYRAPAEPQSPDEEVADLQEHIDNIRQEARMQIVDMIVNLLKFFENEELKRSGSFEEVGTGFAVTGIGIGVSVVMWGCESYAKSEADKYHRIWEGLLQLVEQDKTIEPMQAFERVYRHVNNKFPDWAKALRGEHFIGNYHAFT